MKRNPVVVVALLVVALLLGRGAVYAQDAPPPGGSEIEAAAVQALMGTAFTYQGQLTQNGAAVSATCDFEFRLFDAASGGAQIGATQSKGGIAVGNGLFTVSLDFGAGVFNGDARWLATSVRCPAGAGNYTAITPRQTLTPAPYALALPGFYTIQNNSSPNLIGGHSSNSVTNGVAGATISGGGVSGNTNRVTDDRGTVGGGTNNQAGNDNGVTLDAVGATVGGGYSNTASGEYATVGGGSSNTASGTYATVSGGQVNTTSGEYATVGGGKGNNASNSHAAVGGGEVNTASGQWSVVPGGRNNTALGSYSFAAGRRAKANHLGAFVWGAGTDADVASTGINTFIVRAPGGIWFGIDSSPTTPLDRFINTSTGAHLTTGGVWTNGSDRNSKENFTPVDAQRVLAQVAALPIATWNYRAESPSVRHMGPMAQDFSAAFGLGADDVSIGTIDVDGVALAAIQGLYQLTQAQEAENAAQKAEIAELVNRLAALEGQAKQGAAPSPVFPGWLALLLGLGGVAVSLVWHGRQAGRP
jgi:hypothetical protein